MRRILIVGIAAGLTVAMLASLIAGCTPTPTSTPTLTPTPTPTSTPTPADAEVIELKFGSQWPDMHSTAPAAKWYAEELEKRTEGRLKVTVFTGGALGSGFELPDNIINGVVDMGYGCFIVLPGRWPMWAVASLPLIYPNPVAVNYIMWDLYDRGYLKVEGTKMLAISGVENYRLFLSNKKVTTLEDFKGLMLLTYGEGWSDPARALGMTLSTMEIAELYGGIERGMIDVLAAGVGLPTGFKLQEVLKYAIWNEFGSTAMNCIMNLDKWNSLPPDIQVIMEEVSREFNYRLVDGFCQEELRGLQTMQDAGVDVYNLSPEEFARVKAALDPVLLDKWAADMEAQGLPGNEVKEIVLWDLAKMGY